MKYETGRTALFEAIVHAWVQKKTKCQELTIEFRTENKDQAMFLITKGQLVIAQFSIPHYILEETNPFSGFEL